MKKSDKTMFKKWAVQRQYCGSRKNRAVGVVAAHVLQREPLYSPDSINESFLRFQYIRRIMFQIFNDVMPIIAINIAKLNFFFQSKYNYLKKIIGK